jgi:protein-disulfide isomerase
MSDLTQDVNEHDHLKGRLDAPLVVIEYGDFQCPHCKAAYPVVETLREELGDQLCFVYRNFPLIELHPHAVIAAESAEAASAQSAFWRFHRSLFVQSPSLDAQRLVLYAEMIALDVEQFLEDLQNHRFLRKVERDMESAVRSGVRGTPTFFINGNRHEGGYDLESLREATRAKQPERVIS